MLGWIFHDSRCSTSSRTCEVKVGSDKLHFSLLKINVVGSDVLHLVSIRDSVVILKDACQSPASDGGDGGFRKEITSLLCNLSPVFHGI